MKRKSKLQKKKDNPNSIYWKGKADEAWSAEIRKVGRCEYCNSTGQLNAHHIIARIRLKYRHDLSNGVCLCTRCHAFDPSISPHIDSFSGERFLEWLKTERPDQFQWFEEHKEDKGQPEKTYMECYEELAD